MTHDVFNVVIRPLVTEKGTHQSQTRNAYAFQVARKANKIEIKGAIETIFPDVEVLAVNTLNVRGKPTRSRYNTRGRRSDWKKAIVTLRPEDTIEIYETL